MARFLVFHNPVENIPQEEVIESAQALQRSLPAGLRWLNSWILPKEYRMICEWEAPDEQSIRSALRQVERYLPVEAVHEVEHIQPQWYE